MSDNMVLIAMISAVVLASLGMRIAGGAPWKGAVLAAAFIGGTIGASLIASSLLLAFVAGAIVASILAGAMKIPNKQSANALLGCVVGHWCPLSSCDVLVGLPRR